MTCLLGGRLNSSVANFLLDVENGVWGGNGVGLGGEVVRHGSRGGWDRGE